MAEGKPEPPHRRPTQVTWSILTGECSDHVQENMRILASFAAVLFLAVDSPNHHSVSARGSTGERAAEVVIRDDDLVGRPIVKATYLLYDGYQKTVLIPYGGSPLKAVDIANCHRADVPASPPWPCSPVLHTSEVVYGDTGGHPFGSPDRFHAGLHATESATGAGDYLTVGEIDHGGTVRISYEDAGGDTFTIHFDKAEGLLIYRVVFQPGKGYSAVIRPLPPRRP
jgi:hypothetical protein